MRMFGKKKPEPEPMSQPTETYVSPLPREEKPRTEHPVPFLGSLDEEGTHSWARLAFWQWIFNGGWEFFYPGMAGVRVLEPIKKAISLKIIEVVEGAGQTNPKDPESIYIPILTGMELWDHFSKDQQTALRLIARASALVAQRDQGMKVKYQPEQDMLNPPPNPKRNDDGGE